MVLASVDNAFAAIKLHQALDVREHGRWVTPRAPRKIRKVWVSK